MIYSSKLEDYVREQLRVIQEKDATQQTERLREQQLTAPESTAGFYPVCYPRGANGMGP